MVLGHSDALAAIRKKSRLQLVCYSAHWEICVTQNEEVSKRHFFVDAEGGQAARRRACSGHGRHATPLRNVKAPSQGC